MYRQQEFASATLTRISIARPNDRHSMSGNFERVDTQFPFVLRALLACTFDSRL